MKRIENKEHEEKLVEQRKEKTKHKILHKEDNKKLKCNKKERKAKKNVVNTKV